MSLTKRIIPCLDVKDGRTVKGTNFINLRDAGDIVELAYRYSQEGADELVFLDITASSDARKTKLRWVEQVATAINIPFTVGGGITSESDVEQLLKKGADKISINTSAISNPEIITRVAKKFGEQCLVIAIDAKYEDDTWKVYSHGGRNLTDKLLFSWAKEVQDRGAGEILFTSMNNDGTKKGFACNATARLSSELQIPIIASGGAGSVEDFYQVFTEGKADAAIAAGIFHFGELSVPELKNYLKSKGLTIRL